MFFCFVVYQAFFKFIPLKIGLPIVVVVSLIIQARAKLVASEYKISILLDERTEMFVILNII